MQFANLLNNKEIKSVQTRNKNCTNDDFINLSDAANYTLVYLSIYCKITEIEILKNNVRTKIKLFSVPKLTEISQDFF